MIFDVPLAAGTLLTNVRYKWLQKGYYGVEQGNADGTVAQPDATFPNFRITTDPPPNAEELVAYDATDLSNFNVAGYAGSAIFTVPLNANPGLLLGNLRYKFLLNDGTYSPIVASTGITWPSTDFPVFRLDVGVPDNAESLLLYDSTDAGNFNVAGIIHPVPPQPDQKPPPLPPAPTPAPTALAGRTVPFREILDQIIERHGQDPRAVIDSQFERAIARRANRRIDTAWRFWEWTQLEITEERPFRQIWMADHQYYLVNADGKPSEVLYLPNLIAGLPCYFTVTGSGDPPLGNLPTDTNHWAQMSYVDPYISLDQTCQRPIGEVYGIWDTNPRILDGCGTTPARPLRYRPSEKGIDVLDSQGPTVFVRYQFPVPKFTAVPYIPNGKAYSAGALVIYPFTGECYYALDTQAGSNPPTDAGHWRVVFFPRIFENYVVAGAYADGLRSQNAAEMVSAGGQDVTSAYMARMMVAAQMQRADAAEQEAFEALLTEVRSLQAQGQQFHRQPFRHRYPCSGTGVCVSQPWTGGPVTTLTGECQS